MTTKKSTALAVKTTNSTAELIRMECELLMQTLLAKNSNYGNTAGSAPIFAQEVNPEKALWIRLSDKVARLITLLTCEDDKVGESIDDTLEDAAGYCMLLRVVRRKGTNEKTGGKA